MQNAWLMEVASVVSVYTIYGVPRRKIYKRLWRLFLAFAMVTFVIPDVYSTVVGPRCQAWAERDVSPLYLNGEQLKAIGDSVTILKVPVLPGGYAGLALPGVVALTKEATETTEFHEVVHQEQMRRDGVLRYSITYIADWYRGRYAGCSTTDAYLAISYEKQARETARRASGGGEFSLLEVLKMHEWIENELVASLSLEEPLGCVTNKQGVCRETKSKR